MIKTIHFQTANILLADEYQNYLWHTGRTHFEAPCSYIHAGQIRCSVGNQSNS